MTDPVEAFWQRWAQGQPDLAAFVAEVGPLPLPQLAAIVQLDQRRRWQGDRVRADATTEQDARNPSGAAPVWVERYFQQFPALRADAKLAVDLIFNEFYLRAQLGHGPELADYLHRFPEHAGVLRDQIDLYRALAGPSAATEVGGESQPATVQPAFLPEVFGRYRILRRLGQGGMGTVYLAQDTKLQRQVALKVPRFGSGDPQAIERFYREARIAANFHHGNLCPVYDVGEIQGVHYLTMPLLTGEPLSAWLQRAGPLSPATACRLALLVARAMHVAHQAGVIHRDLKPANIMIQDGVEPVVMDFGLARRGGNQDGRLTATGIVVGTGAYMPPEQVVPDSEEVGPTADVYSLGVILYEMLTGRTPFQGSLKDVLRAVLTQSAPTPRDFRPDLDPRLEAVCLKALAKEPSARFPSMAEMAAALAPFAQAVHPQDTEHLVGGGGASSPPKRRRILCFGTGLAALMIAVLIWVLVFPPTPPAPEGGLVLPSPKPDADKRADERDLDKRAGDKRDKKEGARTPARTRLVLKGHTAAVRSVAFHPRDDNVLASGADDGTVRLWDVTTREAEGLWKDKKDVVLALAFSPNGKRLAVGGGNEPGLVWDVAVWDVPTLRIVASLNGHSYLVSSVAFSPDGATLASGAGDNTIRLWDVVKGEQSGLLQEDTHVNAVAFSPKENRVASGSSGVVNARLWDLTNGKNTVLKGHDYPVLALAFSPDGRTLATGCHDGTIKLWEVASGRHAATLTGHKGAVKALTFRHDMLLISGSADHTLRFWDVATSKCTATLEGHKDAVNTLALSPDGRTMASGGEDRIVILWDVSLEAER